MRSPSCEDDISICERVPARRHEARRVSSENVQGEDLLCAVLKSAFGSMEEDVYTSKTHWLAERFVCQGPTAQVARVMAHLREPFDFPVIVCTNQFRPRPPKELKKLRKVMHRHSRALYNEPNAGGSSEQSEAVSFAMMKLLFGARLEATEMAVDYLFDNCKKIDYLARISQARMDDCLLGVSVTRAYRHQASFDQDDARLLLCKKIRGLFIARRSVAERHAWHLPILHIWCESDAALRLLANELKAPHVLSTIWPLRLFRLAEMPAPVVMLTSASTAIDHVLFKNDDWSDRSPFSITQLALTPDQRHARQRQAFAQSRQSQYARLVPTRYQPPKVPPHLAYFYEQK